MLYLLLLPYLAIKQFWEVPENGRLIYSSNFNLMCISVNLFLQQLIIYIIPEMTCDQGSIFKTCMNSLIETKYTNILCVSMSCKDCNLTTKPISTQIFMLFKVFHKKNMANHSISSILSQGKIKVISQSKSRPTRSDDNTRMRKQSSWWLNHWKARHGGIRN